MRVFAYNRILLLIIAAGLIASLVIAGQRHAVETHNSQVDMAMDYDSLRNLAEREGLEFSEVLQQFKAAGITSLAIYDTTFEKLTRAGKDIAVYGSDIIANYHSGALNSILWREAVDLGAIDPTRVYVIGREIDAYEEAKADVIRRLGEDRVKTFSIGDAEVLEVKAQFGAFMAMPLGFSTAELETAKDAGFLVLARPFNFQKCKVEDVRAVFDRLEGYPISEIVFDGPEILGASDCVDVTATEFKKRGIILGVIEHTSQLQFYPQTGMQELAQKIGYNKVARLYAVPKDEQPRLQIPTLVNRWSTTDRERNIRINLFRTYEKAAPNMTLLETNLKYISETRDKLKTYGYTFGRADTFENYYPNKILRVLTIVGALAAAILYLSLISRRVNANPNSQLIILAVLSVIAAVPIFMGAGGKVRLIAALMSANLFPALAVIWQLDRLRFNRYTKLSAAQLILAAVLALLVTSALSMIGAAYLSGALSDVEYFLEFQIFRGIKLTFILPLILVGFAFLQRFNVMDEVRLNVPATQQIREMLDATVSVKVLLGIFAVIGAFVVLIARSGHTAGMPVSGAEIQVRSLLEQFFYARPRSKEIFIGHPAFVLAIAAFLQRFPKSVCLGLTLLATVGQSSMVETFAHMRTPILMSFLRGVDGVLPGAAIGAVLVLLMNFVWRKEFN